ncbi:uncharacterized protein PADG_00276 [Paracoccidioides brasiliensis Pb18]|uniref:Protein kinase domain-containing protein n=1 Tax=Paracoccidioides brasiliensis (strain Pb18) TaxID=502780 RepID=C1G086_PARBD|nr:uncharacterized protein PADG_00276 [Paracoccidioides brasiliensis Pb18]EEH43987.2 hypothetical protein PADG_00276 [Paracoccidioides brasiliensis Pb18]
MMEFNNIKPSEIIFKTKLFASDYSVIFLVTVRGQICVMKVHHGRGPRRYYEPKDPAKGARAVWSGVIPHFLGLMEKFDPQLCQPYLKMFLHDKYLPSAIFLEYIPNLEMIHLHNYSQKRMDNFIKGLREIHEAGVRHRDPKPRNMMIVKDDAERVFWIDFDRAETYNIPVTDEQKQLLDEEEEIVLGFRDCLQADCTTGKLDQIQPCHA